MPFVTYGAWGFKGPHRMTTLRSICALLLTITLASGRAAAVSTTQEEIGEARRAVPNLDRGAQLFQVCAACHHVDGSGTSDGLVPRIAGQQANVIIKQLVDYRHDRRWDLRMEHFAERHFLADAQAIADVASYVSQLESLTPAATGPGERLERGEKIYSRNCRSCHGENAYGGPRGAMPRLAGQHYEYLRRQIYDAVDGRRPNFPDEHVKLLARLDHDDIIDVCDFLSREGAAKDIRVKATP